MSFQELFQKQRAFSDRKNCRYQIQKTAASETERCGQKNEDKLYSAIYKDFGKSEFDTFSTEISFIYNEIGYYLKNLSSLAHPTDVKTNLVNLREKAEFIMNLMEIHW